MRKRWLALCLIFCLAGCARAEEYYTYGYICGEESAVLYEADDADSRMLGCLFPGTPVTVVAHQGGWYWIHPDHVEQEGMILGYVRAEQVTYKETDAQLPEVVLLGDGPATLLSQDQSVARAMLEPGAVLELLGQADSNWIVRGDGQTGTIPLDRAEPAEQVLAMLDERFLAQAAQDEANRQALQAYQEHTQAQYGPDERAWPLEQRREYARLQALCGKMNVWVDELPAGSELDQESALRLAKACFREMWGIDTEAEEWQIFVAFGYNRMEPHVRLWQFTFEEKDCEESRFLMQLTADDGELYRTSNAEAFMQARHAGGHTVEETLQDTLEEWSRQLGRNVSDWTIEEQYAFAQTPIAGLAGYKQEAALPNDWEIPMDEALSTARLCLSRRFGLEAETLDDWRLETEALETGGQRFYQFSWFRWKEDESLWERLYIAQVDMYTGELISLADSGEESR